MLKKVSPISLIIIVSMLLGCSSTAAFIPTSSAPNTDPGGPAPTVTVPPGTDLLALARAKIKHIVVIMQENRSFDHYFGTYPGADPAGRRSPDRAWPRPGTDLPQASHTRHG